MQNKLICAIEDCEKFKQHYLKIMLLNSFGDFRRFAENNGYLRECDSLYTSCYNNDSLCFVSSSYNREEVKQFIKDWVCDIIELSDNHFSELEKNLEVTVKYNITPSC